MSSSTARHDRVVRHADTMTDPFIQPRVVMVHPAARLRYAVPLALQRAGILERMYTMYYRKRGSFTDFAANAVMKVNARVGRRMLGRRCEELDDDKVFQNAWLGFLDYLQAPGTTHSIDQAMRGGRRFANWIRRKGFGQANALMAFVRNIEPELLEDARDRGLVVVADQLIAPVNVEIREAQLQAQRFPGWEPETSLDEIRRYEAWQMRSWQTLDHLTCPSEYVRQGILSSGIDPQRVSVLPYPVDTVDMGEVDRCGRKGPLTIGFVGAVNLRKGAPYFFEVARRFSPNEARFVMLGHVLLDRTKVDQHKGHVEVVGAVPSIEVNRWLDRFDIFFFPTTCEGSAGAVIEAMASRLPVVTSANSGTFARDGVDGFLRPYDDIDGYERCLRELLGDEPLRLRMGQSARQRVEEFSIDRYSRRIAEVFGKLLNPH